MISDVILIIPCPNCSLLGKKRIFVNSDNFGVELWSDGKKIRPIQPEYPILVKCKKCGSFFMALENMAIVSITQSEKEDNKWANTPFFKFPTFMDYFEALGTIENEKYLRLMIFRSFNDYIRNDNEKELTEEMRDLYIDNLKSFLYLLSEDNSKEFLTIVEINRQLGRFDTCKELLDKNHDIKFEDIKTMYLKEIENGNTKLFRWN